MHLDTNDTNAPRTAVTPPRATPAARPRVDVDALRARARTRYEWTRLRSGLLLGSAALPLTLLSASLCHHRAGLAPIGIALFAVITGLVWRGGPTGRGAVPGLVAGAMPLVGLALARLGGHDCVHGQLCVEVCLPACLVGGLLAGMLATAVSGPQMSHDLRSWPYRLAFLAVGTLTTALGCAAVGLGGSLGLIAGVALGVMPTLVVPAFSRQG
jgi:hypothetical protein